MKPNLRPNCPNFSSGPCAKRPGWDVSVLLDAFVGRSHRAKGGKAKLYQAIEDTRSILGIPDDYRIGIVPGSDTGAVEMALWSMLGERGVDILAWESFGAGWVSDIVSQLKIEPVRKLTADYGDLPNLAEVDFNNDVVFCWNGTTSGVRIADGEWIADDRSGLTICDATSAAFAMELPYDKLDVVTFSWQKALGGEAQHGMLVLSPRAVERLETFQPARPLPKIFRLTKGGKLIEGIFKGETINTPSLLATEDYLDALNWAKSVGGLQGLIKRTRANAAALDEWVQKTDWITYLSKTESHRSPTSICLSIVAPWFSEMSGDDQTAWEKQFVALLESESVAYDIGSYRDAPAGLRIWCGATIETSDVSALTHWLDWAYEQLKSSKSAA